MGLCCGINSATRTRGRESWLRELFRRTPAYPPAIIRTIANDVKSLFFISDHPLSLS